MRIKYLRTLVILLAVVLAWSTFQARACDQTKGGCPPDIGAIYDLVSLGLSMSPVPLNYDPSQREMVGYGSYIVNSQSSCYGCHTGQVNDPAYGALYNLSGYMGGACTGSLCSIDLTPGNVPSWLNFDVFNALVRGVDFCSYPGTQTSKEELKAVVGSLGPTCSNSTGMSYLSCIGTNGTFATGTGNACLQYNGTSWGLGGACSPTAGSAYLQQQRFLRCGSIPAGVGDILQWNGLAWVVVGTTLSGCVPAAPESPKAMGPTGVAPMFHQALMQMSNADLYAVYAYFQALPKKK